MDSIIFTRISNLCKEKGITIKQLSEDLGFAESLIRKWKNTSSPSIDKVKQIADYFKVSTDYLIGLSNIQESAEQLIGDDDFVSLQRARDKMKSNDRERMMKIIRIAFDFAFNDDDNFGNK